MCKFTKGVILSDSEAVAVVIEDLHNQVCNITATSLRDPVQCVVEVRYDVQGNPGSFSIPCPLPETEFNVDTAAFEAAKHHASFYIHRNGTVIKGTQDSTIQSLETCSARG
jgi:hypothetical protein